MSDGAAAVAAASFATLVSWAAAVEYDDLPESVRARSLLVLADDVGAMVAVRHDPQVQALRGTLVRDGQAPEATVFCGGRVRGERAAVAAANGAACDWAELDEGYRPVTCHGGLYVLPAVLAEAEHAGVPTERVILATAVAYEVVARVARAWRAPSQLVHPHALLSPLGAATAAALVRDLPPELCLSAAAAGAGSGIAGPFDHAVRGALVRNAWPGFGAFIGVNLAAWAEAGVGGLPEAPHRVLGETLGYAADLDHLDAGLGSAWAIADGYHKRHACCQFSHAAVEAMIELRPGVSDIDEVDDILVETHPLALALDNPEPATSLAAKFSLQHVAAAALLLGEVRVAASSPEALRDRRLGALREKVRLAPYPDLPPPPHDRPARVVVTPADGGRHEAHCLSAKGGPDSPFGEDELLAKVDRCVAGAYPRFAAAVRDLVHRPEDRAAGWDEVLDLMLAR